MSSLHLHLGSFPLLQSTFITVADSVNIQKKKKLKQQLKREIQADERNIRAARARIIAPRPLGRPSTCILAMLFNLRLNFAM